MLFAGLSVVISTAKVKNKNNKILNERMKAMKKLLSLALALVMTFALLLPVISVSAETTGSITINNTKEENTTYKAYKIFDLTLDGSNYAYSIDPESVWYDFFKTGAGSAYVTIDGANNVSWKDDAFKGGDLAPHALAYAKTLTPTATATAEEFTAKFTGLSLGYYIVDSSLGSACILTTTNPNATINEKNEKPMLQKTVTNIETDGTSFKVDVGDEVNFEITVNTGNGADTIVIHDKMSESLDFDSTSLTVYKKADSTPLVLGTDYTFELDPSSDDCTFHITLTEAFIDANANTDIVINYKATVNIEALENGIENRASINKEPLIGPGTDDPGIGGDTSEVEILKKAESQGGALLDGAKFELYNEATGGEAIGFVKIVDGEYRLFYDGYDDVANKVTELVPKGGTLLIKGLNYNTKYYLEETVTPDGYNKLAERQLIDLGIYNLVGTDAVVVVNKSGTVLPETGGIGTTLFITFGTIAVLGAGVLLVTRRRVSGMID